MSLFNTFKTDAEIEKNGVILQYGFVKKPDGKPDTSRPIGIRVARAGGANTAYLRRAEAVLRPYRRQIQTDTMDRGLIDELTRQLFAETVVKGWENVQDEDGTDLPFTVENCVALFAKLPDLFTDVQEQSQRAALFRTEVMEADAGN